MAQRAPHPCVVPGCPELVTDGPRCPAHAARRAAEIESRRVAPRKRGYDADWEKLRAVWLNEHPLCVACGEPGTDVDHIVPIREAPHLRLARSNLQTMCHPCHSRKTALEDGRFGRRTRP